MVVVRTASVPDIYFKVEATGFPDRLHAGCETKRGITVDFKVFSLGKLKDRVARS